MTILECQLFVIRQPSSSKNFRATTVYTATLRGRKDLFFQSAIIIGGWEENDPLSFLSKG